MGSFDHRPDIAQDVFSVTGAQLTDVDHHVQLNRPVVHGVLSLKDLDGGSAAAVRETQHGTDYHVGAFEELDCQGHVAGFDTHRGYVVPRRQLASGGDIRLGQLGLEQRMVDGLGQLLVSNGFTVQSRHQFLLKINHKDTKGTKKTKITKNTKKNIKNLVRSPMSNSVFFLPFPFFFFVTFVNFVPSW
jgi:hypothetical protein